MVKDALKNEALQNKAVIYARYSPGPQQRDESIDGQIRECKEVAKRAGLVVVDTYIDKKLSGTTDQRPSFQRMLKDSDRGLFNVVITWKIDRFARNRYDSAVYKQRLKKNNVRIIYAREHIPDGPEGVILESVLEGMAEWYSKNLAQNIRRGIRENALKCKAVGGRVPYGYDLGPNKEYLLNERDAAVVLEIFTRYAAGDRVVDICSDLNKRGLRTGTGGTYNRSSLHRMLAQKKYTGLYEYDDISIPDGVPRIVSDELFNAARERTERNKQYKRGKYVEESIPASADFILTGRVFCGHCGGSMCGMSGTGKSGKIFYYYVCHNKRSKGSSCTKKNIAKDKLEEAVAAVVCSAVLSNDEVINNIVDACLEIQAKEKQIDPAANLKAELSEVKATIKNIYQAIESGIFSAGLGARLNEHEQRASELEAAIVNVELETAPALSREQLLFIFHKFRQQKPGPELTRQLLDAFVSRVFVYDDRAVITFNFTQNNERAVTLSDVSGLEFKPAKKALKCSLNDAQTPLYAVTANTLQGLEFTAFYNGFAFAVALK